MNRVWGLPWPLWVLLCVVIAVTYTLVWPGNKVTTTTPLPSYLVLRWGHALVWVLLALSFLLRGLRLGGSSLANTVAGLALGVYALFMVVFLTR